MEITLSNYLSEMNTSMSLRLEVIKFNTTLNGILRAWLKLEQFHALHKSESTVKSTAK